MSEQLRSVSWQNEQLTAEVAALKEQSSLAEMRHRREVEGLRQAAPVTPDVDGRQLPVFAGNCCCELFFKTTAFHCRVTCVDHQ